MKKQKWNVIEEENNRAFLPANDCRRFNGGWVAPPEIKKFWWQPKKLSKETEEINYAGPKFFDRLRV